MKPNIHALILCVAAFACGSPVLAQNQDASALLAEVWTVHGVTASLLDAHVQLHGSTFHGGESSAKDDTLLMKQRGYDTFRIEAHGKAGTRVSSQFQGFLWNRKNNDPVRDLDGRYSLNLPFMDSPSTGLLAYLLANSSRIVYLKESQETFENHSTIRILLKVTDSDPDRIRYGLTMDRHFELFVDSASRQLFMASVFIPSLSELDRNNYRYLEYRQEERVLFPGRVVLSIGPFSGPFIEKPFATLLITKVQLNQKFKDDDFKHP